MYNLQQVGESDIDNLLNEIQRISECYVRFGTGVMSEKWFVAAVKRKLPTNISTDLSMELRKLDTVDAIRDVTNIYRHDHRTGLHRGVPGTMIAMTEQPKDYEQQICTVTKENQDIGGERTNIQIIIINDDGGKTEDFNVFSKGNEGKGGKGYGQCWECGEWGHPRRECLKFIARMGKKEKERLQIFVLGNT